MAQSNTGHRDPVPVDLGLQGGGAHGAFTWGVLDRLLEEPWLQIDGISGTSAGAMNAAVMVCGHARGGARGAREALAKFWRAVSRAGRFSPFQRTPLDMLLGNWTLDNSPAFIAMESMARAISPYSLGVGSNNPLKPILDEAVHFDGLKDAPIKLFITATNVRTGMAKVFRNAEITPDVLLASACLPFLFQAVEIDGEHYWDGGYTGNPTLTPLVRECSSVDTILVTLNTVIRNEVPRSARDINNRMNEITFNSVLAKELRMFALLRQVAATAGTEAANWHDMRVHRIEGDAEMSKFGASSKLLADWQFLTLLRDIGRSSAEKFLAQYGADVGQRSTLDIDLLLKGV